MPSLKLHFWGVCECFYMKNKQVKFSFQCDFKAFHQELRQVICNVQLFLHICTHVCIFWPHKSARVELTQKFLSLRLLKGPIYENNLSNVDTLVRQSNCKIPK